jgi:hypothetical protein
MRLVVAVAGLGVPLAVCGRVRVGGGLFAPFLAPLRGVSPWAMFR